MKFTTAAALLLASLAAAAPATRRAAAEGNLGNAITDTVLTGIFQPKGLSKPIGDIVDAAKGKGAAQGKGAAKD
ncbi:hypothetical protein HRG_003501 [Hirsutella rhossiliensis]|uniref:Uncharacterized protein n=1 Tax=Hirsutella rhossiliensis TaxID=111463 RepID=A0A9P8N244_9HYPO|nr:uncharacterized protein HRG_03501 [Hirsutella rhossiliensis]KAH0965485.1 hypothetical protein HRG_03501 [Hirsutella rhossiliensis]